MVPAVQGSSCFYSVCHEFCSLRFKECEELAGKLADAAAFATYHSASKASLSTPHLYLSSLATFLRRSTVLDTWRQNFTGIPGFTGAHVSSEAEVASIVVGRSINGFSLSPDGTHVAVGSSDRVHIWNLLTGEEVSVLRGHTDTVWCVAYSPDGKTVVSGSLDDSVRVWNLSTGEEVRVLMGHTQTVTAVAYSPDGERIVSGSEDQSVRIWDLSTGKEVWVKHVVGKVRAVAYSPDGMHFVSGSEDGSV
jgi:WD40 repeat protein